VYIFVYIFVYLYLVLVLVLLDTDIPLLTTCTYLRYEKDPFSTFPEAVLCYLYGLLSS